MARSGDRWFALRQIGIGVGAALAYFLVRGITEGSLATANSNAQLILDVERALWLDLELGVQSITRSSSALTTLMNWIYIWLHWPVLIGTLAWLLRTDRPGYFRLRNAMMVSGTIGLLIFATFPVTPPRLFHADYFDTVTQLSHSYRVLQPPMFIDRYAAFPSLHFGWNLLVGIAWARRSRSRLGRTAAILMPAAMGVAIVATANHWTLDLLGGGAVALIGQLVSDRMARRDVGATQPVGAPAHPTGTAAAEPDG